MGFWDALFDYFINPILSFVWENIKAFKDCPSEFETMKENEKVIEKFLNDINRQNHDLERVEGFTKKMEDFKNEIKVIKEDYSRMRIISRLRIGKKLKELNEKFKKEENSMNGFLGLAIQNRGEVNVPINDVTEFESMKKNAVTIHKFIKDIKKVNHGIETLDEFTNEMRELMYEAEDIMADYSHMETSILKENDRLAMAKKLKDFNDKIGIMQSRMDNFLSIASQNKKDVVGVDKIKFFADALRESRKLSRAKFRISDTIVMNADLRKEVLQLRAQVESLNRKTQLQEVHLERITKQLKEETAKCIEAKEVIRSLTAQTTSSSGCFYFNSTAIDTISGTWPTDIGTISGTTEWVEQHEPGVNTLTSLPGEGVKDPKRVRFSRKRFREKQAEN